MPKKNKKGRAAKAGSAVEAPRKPAPVVAAWETYMGSSELEDWQRLMSDLGFEEEFPSKTQCRKALKTVWVNIPDFLHAIKNDKPVYHFPSQNALAVYTKKKRRFFPKKAIDKGSPLKQLLAHIFFNRGGGGYGGQALVVHMGGLSIA
ncbi:hypothetical protein F4825DRAFT_243214 [Nemania diffusa]|nr:hypothetical protein F4825DRAFT_243214 [Nemania diffusa]